MTVPEIRLPGPFSDLPVGAWEEAQMAMGEILRQCAVSLSPVVTGAYQGAHKLLAVNGAMALTIDPTATNPRTGVPVTRYAGAVEARHQVYGRTVMEAGPRAAMEAARIVAARVEEEILHEYQP